MITDIIAALRSTEFCVRKIGMIGFCYGVPATLRFCQQTKIPDNQQWLIDAGVSNHGQIRVPEDIDELCKPFMFICADKDWAFSDEQRRRAEDMLKQRSNAGDYEFHDYPGCWHGFTVRGDNDDEVVRKGKVDAFEKTVAFFEKYL
jgi:dienelactone hydrolase